MGRKHLQPIPPGEILLKDFMVPMQLSINRLARDIQVAPNRIRAITLGKSAITAEIALRLSKYIGISKGIWLDLQIDYDQRLGYHPK